MSEITKEKYNFSLVPYYFVSYTALHSTIRRGLENHAITTLAVGLFK